MKWSFTILTTEQPNNTHLVHKSSFISLEWSIYTVQMKHKVESVYVLRLGSLLSSCWITSCGCRSSTSRWLRPGLHHFHFHASLTSLIGVSWKAPDRSSFALFLSDNSPSALAANVFGLVFKLHFKPFHSRYIVSSKVSSLYPSPLELRNETKI